jgi:hypothetical protein
MTFDELDQQLQNGFHDAVIEAVALDYANRSAVITMQFSVGRPDGPDPDEYRRCGWRKSHPCGGMVHGWLKDRALMHEGPSYDRPRPSWGHG